MKIKIMSKGEIQNKNIPENVAIINFYDRTGISLYQIQKHSVPPNDSIIKLGNKEQILSICADDLDLNFKRNTAQPVSYLTDIQCNNIINFIKKHTDKIFIFQCDYGKSRSLSTAIFAKEYILNEHFFDHHEKVIRNQSFYNLLIKQFKL